MMPRVMPLPGSGLTYAKSLRLAIFTTVQVRRLIEIDYLFLNHCKSNGHMTATPKGQGYDPKMFEASYLDNRASQMFDSI